jgi:NAD(P)-dependent dehydrogenase (short-subunit alcohol dehydrogenase family)
LRIDRRGQQPVDHGLLALLSRLAGRALDPDNPHLHGRYDPWRAYGQSKLADVYFTLELDRRFRAAGLPAKSIVVHPGFTNTDLQARSVRETGGGRSQRFFRAAVQRFGMTPAQGALPLLRQPATREPLAAPCTPRAGSTGAARPPAALPPLPEPGRHGDPVGGVGARDRHQVRHQAAVITPGVDTRARAF